LVSYKDATIQAAAALAHAWGRRYVKRQQRSYAVYVEAKNSQNDMYYGHTRLIFSHKTNQLIDA
jgi:hypothetical protein